MTVLTGEPFPTKAEEFYLRRDHRTNRYRDVDARYVNREVLVTADPRALASLSGQVAFLTTCNLLARWCRRVAVMVEDVALHARLRINGSLVPHALNMMLDADPFGQFVTGPSKNVDLHVHIGEDCPRITERSTVLTDAGWLAGVRRFGDTGLRMRASDNPIGAACSAVLGGAQIFRDALDREDLYPSGFVFDAFTGSPALSEAIREETLPDDPSIGRVLVTGAGSVSSAALFFADLFGVRGFLDLIDGDRVKIENFGRSPLFGRSNFGFEKVYALADALPCASLQVEPISAWWHEAGLSPVLAGYDLVLPLANENDIRWDLQNRVPPLMIHASTGRNWNVNFGRHIPGRDDCLADRFEGLHNKPAFGCSGGSVEVAPQNSIDAALPFLSFFAGVLIATDLVRLSMSRYPHTSNFGNYSFRSNRFQPQLYDLGPRPGCICTSQRDLFWRMRADTRYARFSTKARHIPSDHHHAR